MKKTQKKFENEVIRKHKDFATDVSIRNCAFLSCTSTENAGACRFSALTTVTIISTGFKKCDGETVGAFLANEIESMSLENSCVSACRGHDSSSAKIQTRFLASQKTVLVSNEKSKIDFDLSSVNKGEITATNFTNCRSNTLISCKVNTLTFSTFAFNTVEIVMKLVETVEVEFVNFERNTGDLIDSRANTIVGAYFFDNSGAYLTQTSDLVIFRNCYFPEANEEELKQKLANRGRPEGCSFAQRKTLDFKERNNGQCWKWMEYVGEGTPVGIIIAIVIVMTMLLAGLVFFVWKYVGGWRRTDTTLLLSYTP